MRISRRERPSPATINLHEWLVGFVGELKERYGLGNGDLKLDGITAGVQAKMDPDQLYQVVWNVCENGIRYSRGKPLLEIRCDRQRGSERPYIEVIDSGGGIAGEIAEHLFEPFVTSEARGTGLGLFIARELCEANQATLELYSNSAKGCCFRINFSHPEKRQAIA
jgi:two-component system sensor histidine kinase PilS (NtrC family)